MAAGRYHLVQFLAVFAMLIVTVTLWELSTSHLWGEHHNLKRAIYDRIKIFVSGRENERDVKTDGDVDYNMSSTPAAVSLKTMSWRYSPPYNSTTVGRQFHMDQDTLNIARGILINETYKRRPVELNSVESFPEIVPVTAASSNHFGEFKSHITFLPTYFPGVTVVFYDIGLSPNEVSHIKNMSFIEYRKFEFSRYPPHVKNLHNYAWKSLIIQEILSEADAVMWFDTSVKFQRNMTYIKERMVRHNSGFLYYVGTTGHSIVAATHPRMMEYFPMNKSGAVNHMRQGGAVIVLNKAEVQRDIMQWVCICVLNLDCIAPPGSTLYCNYNFPRDKFGGCHRYDQSLFSILVANTYRYEQVRYALDKEELLAVVDRL